MDATIQDILGLGLPDFLDTHAVPDYQLKAALNLLRCRTAALGGHIEECPEGHTQHVWYNSCRHRSCPQCAFLQIEQWLEKKKELILPCDHYHFIFTQPSELRRLWQYNLETMADLLFHSSSATLTKLLGDEAHLGARPGILAALHTWGRTLVFHPHLHCLVTGGGLTPDGEWKAVRNGFLLPARVVREVYRGKFLEGLEKLLRGGQLQLPPELTLDSALQLLRRLAHKKWNVRIQERYEHGWGVATYLARYMRGGPIKNSRIVACDRHSVTFRYGSHRELDASGRPTPKLMTLSMEEFLSRLLSHVPRPGQHVVRSYGLYSHTAKEALEHCRSQLPLALPPPPSRLALRAPRPEEPAAADPRCCPVCGRRLVRREMARGGLSPPSPSPGRSKS